MNETYREGEGRALDAMMVDYLEAMDAPGPFAPSEREMIAIAVARAYRCPALVRHHCQRLHAKTRDRRLALALWHERDSMTLTPRASALLEVTHIVVHGLAPSHAQLVTFIERGLTPGEVVALRDHVARTGAVCRRVRASVSKGRKRPPPSD